MLHDISYDDNDDDKNFLDFRKALYTVWIPNLPPSHVYVLCGIFVSDSLVGII